jgi:hypothetical protein
MSKVTQHVPAGVVAPHRKPAVLPQWIIDLQARHKDATQRELNRFINQMRLHHQQQMERVDK